MSIRAPQTDLNHGSQRTGQVSGKPETAVGTGSGPAARVAPGDTVTLTSTAAELLKLEESLATLPDMDSQRIAAVRAAIADGSYQIEPDKIVARLLSLEKEIF